MDIDGYVAGEGRCLRHSEEKSNRSSGVLVPPLNSTYHISRNSYEIQKIKSEFIKSESDVLVVRVERGDGWTKEVEKSFPPRHVGEFNLIKVSRQDEGSNST